MRSLLIIPALALASFSFGLTIGDNAPALTVAAVVKGNKVDLKHGIHVVEFWATWCGPCKQSIPHLTELAKKYSGKADFTGVSVWENGSDQLGQVKKFVTEMGPKMNYNVDFDGDSKTMATTWMTAAKQNGIPAAFLVKDGKVLWIGHPMDGLDEAVGQVIDGSFDMGASKERFAKQMAERAKEDEQQQKMATMMKPFSDAYKAKDFPAAVKALDTVEANAPEMKARLEPVRFNILAMEGSSDILSLATRFATDDYKDSAMMLNSLAWSLLDPKTKLTNPNFAAALVLAKQAAEASKMSDPAILDTYALALYKTGDKKQALDIQTKAVDLGKDNKEIDAATLKEMSDRLDTYKKDAS